MPRYILTMEVEVLGNTVILKASSTPSKTVETIKTGGVREVKSRTGGEFHLSASLQFPDNELRDFIRDLFRDAFRDLGLQKPTCFPGKTSVKCSAPDPLPKKDEASKVVTDIADTLENFDIAMGVGEEIQEEVEAGRELTSEEVREITMKHLEEEEE